MMFQKNAFFIFGVLTVLLCTSCSSSKSLENGTYHLNWDNNITLTVSNIQNESDPNGAYYQTCMIQFSKENSEQYIEQLQDFIIKQMVYQHAMDGNAAGNPDLIDENIAYYTKIYENSIDLTKQFVEQPCKFYVYDIVDEEYDSVYTHIDGADEDIYFEITLDSDGSLIIISNTASMDNDIFTK